eukprot:COSAG02_NODE_15512_length_1164_cov_1.188732_1_plen_86_part_00
MRASDNTFVCGARSDRLPVACYEEECKGLDSGLSAVSLTVIVIALAATACALAVVVAKRTAGYRCRRKEERDEDTGAELPHTLLE